MEDKKEIAEKYAERTGTSIKYVSPTHGGRHADVTLHNGEKIRVKWTEEPFYTFSDTFDVGYNCDGVSFNKKQAAVCSNLDYNYLVTGYGSTDTLFRITPKKFLKWALEHDTIRETQFQPNGKKEETASIPITEMEKIKND